MKRPEQHNIETTSRRLLEHALPADWVVRWQGDDYGIDGEIEVFEKGASTGVILKVQIKGTKSPLYARDKKAILVRLPMANARYLCRELRIPTVVVLVDVSRKRIWWYCPQTDPDVFARTAFGTRAKSIVMRIPTDNSLPATARYLLTALDAFELGRCTSNARFSVGVQCLLTIPILETLAEIIFRTPALAVPDLVQSDTLEDFLGRCRITLETVDDPDPQAVERRLKREAVGGISQNARVFGNDGIKECPTAFGLLPGRRLLMSTYARDYLGQQYQSFKHCVEGRLRTLDFG